MRIELWRNHRLSHFYFHTSDCLADDLPDAKAWCDCYANHQTKSNWIITIHTRHKACAYYDYLIENGHEVVGDVSYLFV